MKETKGITLVALVITVIVMLILAGVTINLTLGERGIFYTAQKAAKNYTDAAEKEASELANFQNEIDNTISGLGNGVVTKPEETKQKWEDITPANYGDYVNYEDGLDLGSSAYGHTTDWRVFYKDNDGYVYLISSYYLPYAQIPSGTNLQPSTIKPYTAYWPSAPSSYTNIPQSTYDRYMMKFKYNGSPNNGYSNMKCVSELLDTTKWSKFVNTAYAEDAVGTPTLEMWAESWNQKSIYNNLGLTILNINIKNQMGVDINGSSGVDVSAPRGDNDTLYFPVKSETSSDEKGKHYWLATPTAARDEKCLIAIDNHGYISAGNHDHDNLSVRPIVRLKNIVNAEKVNGVWEFK